MWFAQVSRKQIMKVMLIIWQHLDKYMLELMEVVADVREEKTLKISFHLLVRVLVNEAEIRYVCTVQ